jgi:hypothetical protein
VACYISLAGRMRGHQSGQLWSKGVWGAAFMAFMQGYVVCTAVVSLTALVTQKSRIWFCQHQMRNTHVVGVMRAVGTHQDRCDKFPG